MQTVFTFRSVNTAARPSDKNDDVPRERRRRRPVPVGQKIIIHTATRRRRAALEVGNINNIFFFPTRYSIRVSFDFRALPTRRFGNELPPTPVVTAGDVSRVLRTPLLPAAARRFATDDDDTGDGTRQRLAPRLRPARRRVFAVTVAMLFLKIIAAIPCLVVLPVDATADPDVHPEHAELFSRDGRDGTARCWGYEAGCDGAKRFTRPVCPGPDTGWAHSKQEQVDSFYDQGDFGYVKQQRDEITYMCEPANKDDSSLECTDHLKFCRGHNIMINFTNILYRTQPIRYQMDVLSDGQIGGKCKFHKQKLEAQCDHMSPLQSWSPELRFFTQIDQYPGKCDLIISKPTVIMKIDATVNMYHHFCDFLNLYASLHVNNSGIDMFSKDIHVLIWESFAYESAFSETFQAFTKHPVWNLNTFKGQVVCFNNVVLPLLPRMIFGMYYNTPLIEGCENSGLFKAFSQHILHRLGIYQRPNTDKKIRITFLSRYTKYRNVLNENELISALKNHTDYEVKKVIYSSNFLTFKDQIQITYNTDIFIGMHGAGLTHLLFLPDWAVLFELYNCEDEHCYKDLARLRGVKYITWRDNNKLASHNKSNHSDYGAHAKFTNYSFDKNEFLNLVKEAASHVLKHKYGYSPKSHDEL